MNLTGCLNPAVRRSIVPTRPSASSLGPWQQYYRELGSAAASSAFKLNQILRSASPGSSRPVLTCGRAEERTQAVSDGYPQQSGREGDRRVEGSGGGEKNSCATGRRGSVRSSCIVVVMLPFAVSWSLKTELPLYGVSLNGPGWDVQARTMEQRWRQWEVMKVLGPNAASLNRKKVSLHRCVPWVLHSPVPEGRGRSTFRGRRILVVVVQTPLISYTTPLIVSFARH